MIIEIAKKELYGRMFSYPVNVAARQFCRLTNTKTLSESQLKLIQMLGHEIKVIAIQNIML
jgi:hypothetical protein